MTKYAHLLRGRMLPDHILGVGVTTAVVKCRWCTHVWTVPTTQAQVVQWLDGALIQDAMPAASQSERELMISATCPACWEWMMEGLDDDG